jgi:hypothetical protein
VTDGPVESPLHSALMRVPAAGGPMTGRRRRRLRRVNRRGGDSGNTLPARSLGPDGPAVEHATYRVQELSPTKGLLQRGHAPAMALLRERMP